MVSLEQLAQTCRDKNRWTFFFTSAPANVPGESGHRFVPFFLVYGADGADDVIAGGVASHVNGTAIF